MKPGESRGWRRSCRRGEIRSARARSLARSTMAEMLLAHGANPNTNVYAASSAMYEAQKRRDASMIALLESTVAG